MLLTPSARSHDYHKVRLDLDRAIVNGKGLLGLTWYRLETINRDMESRIKRTVIHLIKTETNFAIVLRFYASTMNLDYVTTSKKLLERRSEASLS